MGIKARVSTKGKNQGVLRLLKHPIAYARSKHIDMLHHSARERVTLGHVNFTYCGTRDMVAYCLTKPLTRTAFEKCVSAMGMT